MPQPLAPKEAAQFRSVIRSYEDKQYKRGIKTADTILKKYPKHGDTMAMKALILNGQGKTDDAFTLAKEALTVDMKSHVCWHVYGLLYRSNKNYEEAIKAYKFALKLEPESIQIQRDLAILQAQMRDFQGYVQSRTAMLQARPQLRQSWTALAISHHLAGNLAEAENTLTTYEGTLKTTPPRHDYEHSEAVMYKNSLIAEQEDYQRALDHLDTAAKHNLDRLAVMEARAEYLAKLGRQEEAAEAYRALLDRNSEHPAYYEKLIAVLAIPESDTTARWAVYEEYLKKSTRCDAARRIPLDFLQGDDFRRAAKGYLSLMFRKGVPSTFANLKHLYSDSAKKEALGEFALEFLESKSADTSSKDKGEAAAFYYLAQHYNYHLSRDLAKAMSYVDKAIAKDSASVEFHMTKARILKHGGDLVKAAAMMEHARTLDLKDRYINSKAAKYQLRINENEKALKTAGLFTRADTVGGPLADFLDMQCIWYLTEDGEAYARKGDIGLALKRFHAVDHIFDVWQEDQFDFHSFSLRKGQIRAYIDMIRWEDHLRDHPFYARAAQQAIQIYLDMANKPSANGVNGDEGDGAEDALAKKKAAKKARKEQQRLEREAAEKAAKQDPNKAGAQGGETKKPDEDPLGLKLAATTDPLGEAMKFVEPLLQARPKSIEAQVLGFQVFMLRKKYVRALRCLINALRLDSEAAKVYESVVAFAKMLETATDLPPEVTEVIKTGFKAVGTSSDLAKYIEGFAAKHNKSPRHAISAIAARRLMGETKDNLDKQVVGLLSMEGITFDDAVVMLETLRQWRSPAVESFKKAAQAKWPGVTRLS